MGCRGETVRAHRRDEERGWGHITPACLVPPLQGSGEVVGGKVTDRSRRGLPSVARLWRSVRTKEVADNEGCVFELRRRVSRASAPREYANFWQKAAGVAWFRG